MGNFFGSKNPPTRDDEWDQFISQTQNNRQRAYQNDEPLATFDNKIKAQTKEKETYKVAINQYIEEKVSIEADVATANNFFVSMTVVNNSPESLFVIRVFEFAIVIIDQESGVFQGVNTKNDKPPLQFDITGPEYNLKFPFFLGNNSCKTNPKSQIYPIIVEIRHPEGFSTIYKYTLQILEEWAPHLVEKALVINNKYTILDSVYGLRNSSLVNRPNGDKCLICMTNDIDVMISPCNHMCLCYECIESYKQSTNLCPMCRRAIGSFVKMVLKDSHIEEVHN